MIEEGGFTNLDTHFDAGLSYQFGGRLGSLDHVLANAAAMKLVTGADVWDINSDEAVNFEYSRRNYNVVDFFANDVFRASDHDPIKVGFKTPAGKGIPRNPMSRVSQASRARIVRTVQQLRTKIQDLQRACS